MEKFKTILKTPLFSYAFRPFYLLASFYGILSILLWAFGYQGTSTLPAHFWHGHEMIFGYSAAVIVGFLLTAVATWTKTTAVKEGKLFLLCLLWLLGRVFIFFASTTIFSFAADILFFILAAAFLAQPVIATRDTRNYVVIVALIFFAAANCDFFVALTPFSVEKINNLLLSSLLGVVGFIGLISSRVLPFFIARRLGGEQIKSPEIINYSALNLPLLGALFLILGNKNLASVFLFMAGSLALIQSYRWFRKEVLKEPMLWILHLGYFCSSMGLIFLALEPFYLQIRSFAIHTLGLGAIGFLTIGMITRTALGHTGRAIYPAPKGVTKAFYLMILAALIRLFAFIFASSSFYFTMTKISALCFASSLAIYIWIYLPWLIDKRADEF